MKLIKEDRLMQKWEYLFVSCSIVNDAFRPYIVNGNEPKDWKKGPTMYEFANQMGEQGWELVTTWGEYSATKFMTFKRPKE